MGQEIFDSDGTFTVPANVVKVSICAVGGGGSGSAIEASTDNFLGGGFAGSLIQQDLDVVPEQTISIEIGIGGEGVVGGIQNMAPGKPGKDTLVDGTIVAEGGNGGSYLNYMGNGAGQGSPCGDTYYDGDSAVAFGDYTVVWYGGQASALGDGGDSAEWTVPSQGPGIYGSGGSASLGYRSGEGGDGRVIFTWDDPIDDGGLLMNGTDIPEGPSDPGTVTMYCKDTLGEDFSGPVHALVLDGTEVWRLK